jgi:carbon-monoxide dehydrogenase large subunit
VEVDREVGRVRILRYVVVADVGPLINPAIVAGQLAGGIAQGIGEVLLEDAAYGADGQPLATSFADYLLPTCPDVPPIEVHHVHGPPTSAIDFRGVGECGAVGSPAALANAIEDALSPFGCRIVEQYLPPERIVSLAGGSPERPG